MCLVFKQVHTFWRFSLKSAEDSHQKRGFRMNLFFEENKSIQPFRTINRILSIVGVILIALFLLNDFDIFLLQLMLNVSGLSAFTEGIESMLIQKKKKQSFFSFGIALIYFAVAFYLKNILLNI